MRMTMFLAAIFGCLAFGTLQADEGEGKRRGGDKGERGANAQRDRADRDGADRDARRAEFLKRFDKDESGDLDEEERAAARAAFAERGGKQGDRRRGGPGNFDRAALMKKFDKDESGDLNEEEKAALKAHFAEMRAKRGEGQRGEGQRRGRPGFDREKIIAEFDKDEDGKLNEEERAAAKAAMKERFEKMRQERGGKDRPRPERQGKPQRRERPAN